MVRFIVEALFNSTKLVISLLSSYAGARIGRRMAVRSFVRALTRYGVPRESAKEMAEAYPQLPDIRALLRALNR